LPQFYGLFKQSNEGDINTPKPGMMQFTERGKWTAWESQKGKDSKVAKREYKEAFFAILDRVGGAEAEAIKKRVTGTLLKHGFVRSLLGKREGRLMGSLFVSLVTIVPASNRSASHSAVLISITFVTPFLSPPGSSFRLSSHSHAWTHPSR
jgi:hypothetical protein